MNITGILIACLVVGGAGIVIGVLLGIAGKKFAVEVDEKAVAIREALPGSNCGGCGYAGCDALAQAIADGTAPVTVKKQETNMSIRVICPARRLLM